MSETKKTLLRKALKRFPDKIIQFVSDKTNWDDCFMVVDFEGIEKLVLWYNVGEGTYCESIAV